MPLKVWQRSNGQADKDAQEPQKMPLIPRDLVAGCHEAHSLQIQLGNVPDVVHQGEEPQEEGEDGLLSLIQVLGKVGDLATPLARRESILTTTSSHSISSDLLVGAEASSLSLASSPSESAPQFSSSTSASSRGTVPLVAWP